MDCFSKLDNTCKHTLMCKIGDNFSVHKYFTSLTVTQFMIRYTSAQLSSISEHPSFSSCDICCMLYFSICSIVACVECEWTGATHFLASCGHWENRRGLMLAQAWKGEVQFKRAWNELLVLSLLVHSKYQHTFGCWGPRGPLHAFV